MTTTIEPVRPSWCEIDLSAIAHNLAQLRSIVGKDVAIFVCLKDDAMGCGTSAIAVRAEQAGADGLALGRVDDAVACRRAGATLPMLLYPSCLPEWADLLADNNLMPTISTLDDVAAWSACTREKLKVFLKIDGGGYRAGAFPEDAADVARAIVENPRLEFAGVYGHTMANYGFDVPGYVPAQIESFIAGVHAIEQAGIPVPRSMVSSSATILGHPKADLNGIDPGRLVLGLTFPAVSERRRVWRPAVRAIRSRLVMVKSLDHAGALPEAPFLSRRKGMRLGLIPLGWSDGYPARPPAHAEVLVRGKRAPVIPPIHSEIIRIDLTECPDAVVGDEVVLLGASGAEEIRLDELCDRWGMADFEIYASLVKGLPKVYAS